MRFGLDVAQQRMSWDELVSRVRFAEALGFDGVWGFDHFKPMYGDGPGECFEGMTTLAALAGCTERVRLGLLVTGITYRHPSVLAAEALTVDHASHGRLELALGAAWFDEEHHELGIPFPPTGERVERFQEAVQVIRLLLTRDDVAFDGTYHRLAGATLRPRPVQSPHPPIWIGASGERRMLPFVGRAADAWHSWFGGPDDYARKARIVDGAAEAAGRDPRAILRATNLSTLSQPMDPIAREVDGWRDAGLGYLVAGWPAEGRAKVDEFAARFLSA